MIIPVLALFETFLLFHTNNSIQVVSKTSAAESLYTLDNAATVKGISAGLTEHLVKIQKPVTALHAADGCPLKSTKHSEAGRQVNFEKETIGAAINARKSSDSSIDVVSDPNILLHANQQQHSSYSSSGSSSSSPVTKPL